MLQEQRNKFSTTYCFDFGSVVVRIILISERHGLIRDRTDPAVADGCAVSITGKVGNGVPIAVKSLLDKWEPVPGIKGINKILPNVVVTQSGAITDEFQEAFIVVRFQLIHKLATEHPSNCLNGKKKSFVA